MKSSRRIESLVMPCLIGLVFILGFVSCSEDGSSGNQDDEEQNKEATQKNKDKNSDDDEESEDEEDESSEDEEESEGEKDKTDDEDDVIPDNNDDDENDEGVDDSTEEDTTDTDTPEEGDAGLADDTDTGESLFPNPEDLVVCQQNETTRDADCGSIETMQGATIEFGPYGAHMDTNVGEGFGTSVAVGDRTTLICRAFADTFGAPANETARLLDTADLKFALYTVYRPAVFIEGEKYPLITWGNGTCAQPEGYGALLRYMASYGYVVVAANSRWVGNNRAMPKGLDFMFAANDDPESPYYQKIDTERVGAMGHSQGGMATVNAASDARIKTVIIWNGGNAAAKPFLAVSGDRDVSNTTPQSMGNAVNNSAQPGAFLYYHKIPGNGAMEGHLTLMREAERVVEPALHWFEFTLRGKEESRDWFIGNDCGLCNKKEDFEYDHNANLESYTAP